MNEYIYTLVMTKVLRGDKLVYIKPLNEIPIANDSIYYHRILQYGDKIVCVGNGTQNGYNRVIVGQPYANAPDPEPTPI